MSSAVMSSAVMVSRSPFRRDYNYEAISAHGRQVLKEWDEQRNFLRGSASDWLPTIRATLRSIRDRCGKPDWDGQGETAVSDEIIAISEEVLATLFSLARAGTPPPDIVPEADGEICLSWTEDPTRTFSVSVGKDRRINFAGQFGIEGAIHGWKQCNANAPESSLQDIAGYLENLYPSVAARRAA